MGRKGRSVQDEEDEGMKEDMEDNGNEKTRMGKLKTKWKENGLDERCNQNRRERNRTGRREREKETH